jgi:hypothetical protein
MGNKRDVRMWKEPSRGTVEGPSGLTYEVRSVELAELTAVWEKLPSFLPTESPTENVERTWGWREMLQSPEHVRKLQKIVALGLVDPVVGDGPDEVAMSEIPAVDLFSLLTKIIELSGMSNKARDQMRPTSSDPNSA